MTKIIITGDKRKLKKHFNNFYLNKVYAINANGDAIGTFDTLKEARDFYKDDQVKNKIIKEN